MAFISKIGNNCDFIQAKWRLRDKIKKVKLKISTKQIKYFFNFKNPNVIDLNIETKYLNNFNNNIKIKGNSNNEV